MTHSTAVGPYTVTISLGGRRHIEADLQVPSNATGLVIFAHGSGSSRFSARNQAVANALCARGHATLLLDLLTRVEEEADEGGKYRFDVPRLADRIIAATEWASGREETKGLPVGYFGASTGAAAALVAAAIRPRATGAIVSRGGRPDLADAALPLVLAPTLLIVGGEDREVLRLNEEAMVRMTAHVELTTIAGATHLFEESGALEQVEELASTWFGRYVSA